MNRIANLMIVVPLALLFLLTILKTNEILVMPIEIERVIIFVFGSLIFVSAFIIKPRYRKQNKPSIIGYALSPPVKIPPTLDSLDEELQELGLYVMGSAEYKYDVAAHTRIFKIPMININFIWSPPYSEDTAIVHMYTNERQDTFAFIPHGHAQAVIFTSYFKDGLDISTDYPRTPSEIPTETPNLIRHSVKTSISAAFDYHQHHVGKQAQQHGDLQHFETVQEILDWENKQGYSEEVEEVASQQQHQIIIVMSIFGAIVGIVVFFVPMLLADGDPQPPSQLAALIPLAAVVVGVMLWSALTKAKTVEERKQKK